MELFFVIYVNSCRDVINNSICVSQYKTVTLPVCRKPTAALRVKSSGKVGTWINVRHIVWKLTARINSMLYMWQGPRYM